MHAHTNDVVISQSNSIANNKSHPTHNFARPSLDAFRPFSNMEFCFLVMTGQALLMSPKGRNASRDGLVKLWKEAFIICNTITL